MADGKKYNLEERLIEFALKIDLVIESLPNTRLSNHLAGQMVRRGTAPALNYGETQSVDSQKDFIHKMFAIFAKSVKTAKSKLIK